MTLSYFVYYRVAPAHASRIVAEVRAMQTELEAATGIVGRLMQKDDASGTWMEIYEGVATGTSFEADLQHAAARAELLGILAVDGKRQVERFATVD